jgi:peptidoglycan-N-acetylglucosamine deacetylase
VRASRPHAASTARPRSYGDAFTTPEAFVATWPAEFESARAEHRHVTYAMHPEVIGRRHRAAPLDRPVKELRERGDRWFATHGDVARWVVR